MRIAPAIVLSEPQRVQLTGYARGRKVPLRVSQRAKILLLASDGKQNEEIARALATSPPTVARWRLRFIQQGVAGIETDAPRPGRNPSISSETVQEIVRKTTQEKPPQATQWSTRSMARVSGVSAATVRRIWRKHGLKPHRVRTFKLSNDPRFAEKLADVVGLYLNRRSMRSCCRWTRRPRFKHSTGLSRACL